MGSTLSTFLSKAIFTLTFIVPLLLVRLPIAVSINVVWGLLLLGLFSFFIAKEQRASPWKVIVEHVVIALVVITLTHYVGDWISRTFM